MIPFTQIAPTPAFLVVLSMEPTESLLPLLTYLEECEFSTEEKEWTAKAILECCLLRDKAVRSLNTARIVVAEFVTRAPTSTSYSKDGRRIS